MNKLLLGLIFTILLCASCTNRGMVAIDNGIVKLVDHPDQFHGICHFSRLIYHVPDFSQVLLYLMVSATQPVSQDCNLQSSQDISVGRHPFKFLIQDIFEGFFLHFPDSRTFFTDFLPDGFFHT